MALRYKNIKNKSEIYDIFTIDTPPGVSKIKVWKTKLKTTLVSQSTKIWPIQNEIQKTFRKQGFFDIYCSIKMVFQQFLQFWLNLSALTHQGGLQFGRLDFLTPLAPLGACQQWSEMNFGHLDHCSDLNDQKWIESTPPTPPRS